MILPVTSPRTVTVNWDASTDAESSVGGYQVFRDGAFRADVAGTSFDDSGLSPSTSNKSGRNAAA